MDETRTEEALMRLPDWYRENARDLPWRADREPYHVWISEIMLQQTRAEAVKAYYLRFMEELPSVDALAVCGETRLLKLWEGLGYYSRARNLHAAAKTIMEEYAGLFPDTYEKILSLRGIGPYTAGAISSIAFRLPQAAVDGNVLRVICRLTDDARDMAKPSVKKEISEMIRGLLLSHPQIDPGIVNQALMELGAIVCVPNGAPVCKACPWNDICQARKNATTDARPVKAMKKARRIEHRTILLVTDGEKLMLHRRPAHGLLAGMYEPVNPEGYLSREEALEAVRGLGLSPVRIQDAPEAKHIFTHIEWHMRGYLIMVEEPETFAGQQAFFFVDREMIGERYAVPSAFRVYMETWMGKDV